ncbi:hypothetical protein B0T26DRAFT_299349 [Lasiosphaeria miniovina]|uniref:Uncharacterized protein n=1 Tax=Lasiosphaeria miniovina TaxID=1954250 RepID=A0AA40AKL3_9PEZI|nr:uncharacterized protein B0T26DRAFT_299349 [Lasiosphaeria miniovina]KAK0717565.1 hypothetical protein B0T26DRAFT_299349 [Lasiosphaeria miniovina]
MPHRTFPRKKEGIPLPVYDGETKKRNWALSCGSDRASVRRLRVVRSSGLPGCGRIIIAGPRWTSLPDHLSVTNYPQRHHNRAHIQCQDPTDAKNAADVGLVQPLSLVDKLRGSPFRGKTRLRGLSAQAKRLAVSEILRYVPIPQTQFQHHNSQHTHTHTHTHTHRTPKMPPSAPRKPAPSPLAKALLTFIGTTRTAFGIGCLIAPELAFQVAGLSSPLSAEASLIARQFGVREIVVGAGLVLAERQHATSAAVGGGGGGQGDDTGLKRAIWLSAATDGLDLIALAFAFALSKEGVLDGATLAKMAGTAALYAAAGLQTAWWYR